MKQVHYHGVKRSDVKLSAVLPTTLKQAEAAQAGILVPKGGKRAAILGWGDVLVCLKDALLVSPEMRSDLKALLEACESTAVADHPSAKPVKRGTLLLICQERGLWGPDHLPQFLVPHEELLGVLEPLLPGISSWTEWQALAYLNDQHERRKEPT